MRYYLFAGNTYYPSGGWEDFRGSFDTIEEAKGAWNSMLHDWFHVVDTATRVIVAEGNNGFYE